MTAIRSHKVLLQHYPGRGEQVTLSLLFCSPHVQFANRKLLGKGVAIYGVCSAWKIRVLEEGVSSGVP